MYKITETERNNIFSIVKDEFLVYKSLEPYEYLFITESGLIYNGLFLKKDFIHLAGIVINDGNDDDFYGKLEKSLATENMIADNQKYDMKTINKKGRIMKNLKHFVDNNLNQGNLLIENYSTLTTDYLKYALRNDERKFTLAFTEQSNARSSRYELSSIGTKREKILCIFRKTRNTNVYDSLIYKDNSLELVEIINKLPRNFRITEDGNLMYIE